MNYVVRKLEINDIKELSKIMKKAFLSEPWIEDWNEQSCFERLNILCSIPTSFSFTLVNENNEICGAAIGYVIPFVNKNEYDLQGETEEERKVLEYLKKYKLASSEGVNKLSNRMIRFEVLKKILLQFDSIESKVFELIKQRMEELVE